MSRPLAPEPLARSLCQPETVWVLAMKKLDPSPPTPRRLAPQVGPWEPDRRGLNRERACLGASGRPTPCPW